MTERVIGPTGSPRRRWTLLLPIVAVFAVGILYIAGAQAVNATGAFELEGNAVSNTTDDWDRVCHQVTADGTDSAGNATGAQCQSATNTNGATAVAWVDSRTNQEIYTGGGSKDFNDPQADWLWKPKDTVPDKDTITHSFAARYSLAPSATTCPVPAGQTTCEVIFFGSDRFANDGDSQLGFWFFQNKVETTNTAAQGGFKFSGEHKTGDLLVISNFSNGGTTSSINVYSWNPAACPKADSGNEANIPVGGCPAKNLKLENKSINANCATSGATVPTCGIVNPDNNTTAPWPFLDKTGNSNFQQGEFFEAGLNLSGLGFGGECFASVLAESRSSTSTTAVLKDFVLSNFGSCDTTLTTTANGPTGNGSIGGGSVSSGTDSATLTINGTPTWGGTLDFYLCGPFASGVCDDTGVKVSSVPVSQATTMPVASGNGTTTGTALLTSAGRYCWFARFTPDAATAAKGVSGEDHDGSGGTTNAECFTVTKVTPTLTTNAGAGPVDLGQPITDTATLSGAATEPGSNGAISKYGTINATNGVFAGTIQFTLKGPAETGCGATTTGGTGTNPSTPINVTGNVQHGPVSYTPALPGLYHWQATYTNTGSANNNSPVTDNGSCDQAREDVRVRSIPTQMSTAQKVFPQDSATLTSSLAGDSLPAGGTLTFRLYQATPGGNSALQNCLAHGDTLGSGGLIYKEPPITTAGGTTETKGTDNKTVSVDANGSYYWYVTYAPGDTAHIGRQSNCTENTVLTFNNDAGTGTAFP